MPDETRIDIGNKLVILIWHVGVPITVCEEKVNIRGNMEDRRRRGVVHSHLPDVNKLRVIAGQIGCGLDRLA